MPIYESYITHSQAARDPQAPIVLRDEQKEAVRLAKRHFNAKGFRQFLWNAKMRFGKTLSALQLAKEMGVQRTLIVTHRPVVKASWYEDFKKVFRNDGQWHYASVSDTQQQGDLSALEKLVNNDPDQHYVFFASMQYLRRSSLVNPKESADDNPLKKQILENDWNLVIIDEAHEGTSTALGDNVKKYLRKPGTKMLQLSGTPYKIMNDFAENEVFTWDYVMEQEKKRTWKPKNMFDTDNPYAVLPELKIFTYDLAKLSGSEAVGEGAAFTLSEFFRTWRSDGQGRYPKNMPEGAEGDFVHKEAVRNFLDLLCSENGENNYPFSTEEYQENFKHTLWVVPGVREAKALAKILREHDIFSMFDIINVAGDGDADEQRADALDSVLKKIGDAPDQTNTITISCGRLTTGVTVPPWTAVFYLKGSESTSAATYMQTIFRVQSHHIYNGMMKSLCYVFDFAPDRSLAAVAEAAKFSAKARKLGAKEGDEASEKEFIEEFLKFCPVISLDGGRMVPFNVDSLFEGLNRVYNQRIALNGFNDNALYDTRYILDTMTGGDIDELNEMGVEIGQTTNMEKPPKAKDISRNGLTPAQRQAGEKAAKKDPKERTPEEQEAYEALKKEREERRKEKENRIKILRGISLRIPLLIFGGKFSQDDDDEITLDNFTRKVDDRSWEEFMPRGVTKEKFNRFKRCYNVARFEGAGRLYRQWTREADSMHVEERIKAITDIHDMFHNPDKETVLTPWRVVNMHLSDCLGGYCFYNERFDGPNQREVYDSATALIDYADTIMPRYVDLGDVTSTVFNAGEPDDKDTSAGTRILEINSKTGLYPLYATYSIYRRRVEDYINAGLITDPENLTVEEEQVIWDDVLQNNIYVISNTPMAEAITRRTLRGFRHVTNTHIKNDQIVQRAKTEPEALAAQLRSVGYWNGTNAKAMLKFTAVIGNPPYQVEGGTASTRKEPIYHLFYNLAFGIGDIVSLITPGRYLFRIGQTPKDWTDKILQDLHFSIVSYFPNSADLFPSVEIKGGIAVSYWNKDKVLGPINSFSPSSEMRDVLSRVANLNEISFKTIVSSQGFYKFTPKIFSDFPKILEIQGKGTAAKITSNIFESLPEAFLFEDNGSNTNIKMLGRADGQRTFRWIDKEYIRENDYLDYINVVVPKANGTGAFGDVISSPLIIMSGEGHTDSFVSIGKFDHVREAECCIKYISTKFVRALLGTLKVTQDITKEVWANVPLQDFTSESDIDWSKEVEDIDRQLYRKYGLDAEEIDFIERMIKPMK